MEINGSEIHFEIKDKDILGRICKLKINNKLVETPLLMPVYNPKNPVISIDDLKNEFKIKAVMVNAYLLLRDNNLREEVLNKGLHRFLNFDGIIATDSGSYQLMEYGNVLVDNQGILDFEERIGSDIASFLDIPSLPDAYKPRVKEQLLETLKRAEEARKRKIVINAGIQGSTYLDLRKKAAKEIGKRFKLCAAGGIVPLMEKYEFSKLVDILITIKKNLPADRILHGFGLGHPMVFPLAIGLGYDIFDSAAYVLYAKEDRYMTESGTKHLDELEYIFCNCPICKRFDLELKELPQQERIEKLAKHNLYVTLGEINRIKQAIKEGNLWELLSLRCRSHPQLLSGLERMMKYSSYISEFDRITKKSAFFYLGNESIKRPEVVNSRKRLKRVKSKRLIKFYPFGEVPLELMDLYPFNATLLPESKKKMVEEIYCRVNDREKIERMLEYQFGENASRALPKEIRIKKSAKTGRIRWIYHKNELIASVRASDHFIIPKPPLGKRLLEVLEYPKARVVINKEAVPFVKEGKSVFAKFVLDLDSELRAGDEVLVVDEKDNYIRTGTLILSPKEVRDFRRGVVVKVR